MKVYFLFVALLGTQTIDAYPQRSETCPDCSQYEDGETLPDVNSCSQYYLCVGGKALPKRCAHGLYYDSVSGCCNRAFLVDCAINRLGQNAQDFVNSIPHIKFELDIDHNNEEHPVPHNMHPTSAPKTCTTTTTTTCPKTRPTAHSPTMTATCATPAKWKHVRPTTCSTTTTCTTPKPCENKTITTCSTTTTCTTPKPCENKRITTCSTTTTCTTPRPCKNKTITTCSTTTCTTPATCSTTAPPCTKTKAPNTIFKPPPCRKSSKDCITLPEGQILLDCNHRRRYYVCSGQRTKRIICRPSYWFDPDTLTCRPRS